MSNAFLSSYRVRDKASFNAVFDTRKRLNSSLMVLRYKKNPLDFSRLGIILSKRNVHLSVDRNRIRRVVREQFRLHPIKLCGYDIVFVIYKQAVESTNSELRECIVRLFDVLTNKCG